jgi:phytoene dehydrogenase-like protein
VRKGPLDRVFAGEETTTERALRREGFSEELLEGFLRPWLAGVFLERELATSSRMMAFVLRMFAEGDAALPATGMGEIPRQIASRLGPGTVRTGARVRALEPGAAILDGGERVEGGAVVVATDGRVAADLLPDLPRRATKGVTCLYFAAERDPVGEPVLVLDGEGKGPVNNLCVPSTVAPSYAPPGAALISASVLGVPEDGGHRLEAAVRDQMHAWFGREVATWRHLRTMHIPHALPDQTAPALREAQRPVRHAPGVYVCGDHRDNASIQGAMVSGRRAADAVLAEAVPVAGAPS